MNPSNFMKIEYDEWLSLRQIWIYGKKSVTLNSGARSQLAGAE